MVIPVPKLKDHTFALGGSRLGASLLEDGRSSRKLRYPSLEVCLDPFVKLSIVDMLKCTNTHVLCLDLVFMNSLIKTSLHDFYVY